MIKFVCFLLVFTYRRKREREKRFFQVKSNRISSYIYNISYIELYIMQIIKMEVVRLDVNEKLKKNKTALKCIV